MWDEAKETRLRQLCEADCQGILTDPASAELAELVDARCRQEDAALERAARRLNDETARMAARAEEAEAQNRELEALLREQEAHLSEVRALCTEVSTEQAAELLGVSHPYLIRLLDEGRIPLRKVGAQRRVRFDALRRYAEAYQQEAGRTLDEITAEAQAMGLYE